MILGDYELGPEVGQGAMGSVHLAYELVSRAPVAVKRLHPRYADQKMTLRRFGIEVQTASRLHHPNIVSVLDSGTEPRGTPYCVMEWVAGMSLDKWSGEEIPWAHLSWLLSDLLAALAYAHARGVVHRDLKPANILIEDPFGDRPRARLTDFGIARLLEADSGDEVTVLTMQDKVVGTPAYLSPEQALGGTNLIGPHTDLYSLGIIAYELASGTLPFPQASVVQLLTAHASTPAPLLDLTDRPNAPVALQSAVRWMLKKSPEERPQSALEVREALKLPEEQERGPLPRAGSMAVAPEMAETVMNATMVGGPAQLETIPSPTKKWLVEPVDILGRDKEIEQLKEQADQTLLDRRSRLVFVHGVAGIGKSRLVQEVRYRLEESGAYRGARLVCPSGGSEDSAVKRLLARLLLAERLTGRLLNRRLQDVAGVYQLTPLHVHALMGWLGEEERASARTASDRIDVAARILRQLASRRPLALIIEGADAESARFSLAVLENLFSDEDKDTLLFVMATSRRPPDEVSGGIHELYELLSDEGRAVEVELSRLSDGVVAALVEPLAGPGCAEIARRAEGNPLFAIELARLRAGLTHATGPAFTMPGSMGDVWERRVEGVMQDAERPDICQCVLVAAAILGPAVKRSVLLSEVAAAFDASARLVEAALDLWVKNEVLADDGERDATIQFVHSVAQEYALEHSDLKQASVLRLLSRLADRATETRSGVDPHVLERIAQTLNESGDHARAVKLRLLAGELFLARLEYARAHVQLEAAAGAAVRYGETELQLMATARLSQLHLLEGHLSEAANLLTQVDARRTNPVATDPEISRATRADHLRARARVAVAEGRYAAAVDMLEGAIALLGESADPVTLAEMRTQLSSALDEAGDMAGAERHVRLAIKALDRADAPRRMRAGAYIALAGLCRRQGRHPEAEEAAGIARPLAEEAGARREADSAMEVLLQLADDAGDLDRAVELGERMLEQRTTFGDKLGVCRARYQLGVLERHRGNLDAAYDHHTASLEQLERLSNPSLVAANLDAMGRLQGEAGENSAALRYFRRARAQYESLREREEVARVDCHMSLILRASSRPVKAERLTRAALRKLLDAGDQAGVALCQLVLGLLASDKGNWSVARELFTEARNAFAAMGKHRGMLISEAWLALSEAEAGNVRGAEMTARMFEDKLRERPIRARTLVPALEGLAEVVGRADQEAAWRLQTHARRIEDSLQRRST